MSLKKKILWGLATILIAMQFFQPQPNQSDKITDLHVEKLYEMPREVKAILTRSCYDCHSDNTTYPLVSPPSASSLVYGLAY